MKLLIRNLDRETKVEDLKQHFEKFGSVQSCTIVMDDETGKSKGFGFATMPKAGEATAAMKNLNGKKIDGQVIRVKKASNKPVVKKAPKQRDSNDPMHGMTLEKLLNKLVEEHGFEKLGKHIKIKCFTSDPSISSSLTFLRKTKWARQKLEEFYLEQLNQPPARKKPKKSVWGKPKNKK